MNKKLLIFVSLFSMLALTGWGVQVQAQQGFMSPYKADSNTVLLLHYNDTLANSSNLAVEDAKGFGNYQFTQSGIQGFGQMLYLKNDAEQDSSFLLIPDTSKATDGSPLDLKGNWTMESWVQIITYGETSDDHRWRPKMLVKSNREFPAGSNYFNVMRGDLRAFHTGYHSPGNGWRAATGPNNSFFSGTWYHVTYIRDTVTNTLAHAVHNIKGELVYFTTTGFVEEATPNINNGPVSIGINPGQGGGWLDGFMDETRVSDVIRPSFKAPPLLSHLGLVNPGPKPANEQVGVSAHVGDVRGDSISSNQVAKVTLHYKPGNAAWDSTTMSLGSDGYTYSGSVPGQSSGTIVKYFVTAKAKNGLKIEKPRGPSASKIWSDSVYNSYVVADTGLVMDMDFENGTMPPENKTEFTLNADTVGNPKIDTKMGAGGTGSSLYLNGDSSYVAVRNPEAHFLKSERFVVDFWFRADTLPEFGTRFLIKEGEPTWNNFNYQIWSTGGGDITPASYVKSGRTGYVTAFDSTFTADKWYRIAYVSTGDSLYAKLWDADSTLIQEVGGDNPGQMHLSDGPLFLGTCTWCNNNGVFYKGWLDEIRIYTMVPDKYKTTTGFEEEKPSEMPQQVTLGKNYPNPFNPSTKITYSLPRSHDVTLKVYDVLGREVATLVDKKQNAGRYTVEFNAARLSSGLYFYRLETENVTKVRKMMLVK